MLRTMSLVVVFGLLVSCTEFCFAIQQNEIKKNPQFDQELNVSVVFREQSSTTNNPTLHDANLKLEPVMAGSKVRINFTLSNPGAIDLDFDRVETSCGCFSFTCERTSIPAGVKESVKAVADFRVPTNAARAIFGVNLQFQKDKKLVGHLALSGPIQGLLAFPAFPTLESTGDFSEWKLPLIVTEPVKGKNLEVSLSSSLRDMSAKIEVENDQPKVVLSCPINSLGPAGIAGEITVSEPKLGLSVTRAATFLKRPVIRISPLTVMLTVDPDDREFGIANVLIQAVDQPGEGEGTKKNAILSVECSSPNAKMQISQRRMNDSLFRVKITTAHQLFIDKKLDEIPIRWKVRSTLGDLEIDGAVLFMR